MIFLSSTPISNVFLPPLKRLSAHVSHPHPVNPFLNIGVPTNQT